MTPDDIVFEHLTDREILIQLARDVAYINQRLQEGAQTIQNHEMAIRGFVTRSDCERRHAGQAGLLKWAVGLLVTGILGILALIFKK